MMVIATVRGREGYTLFKKKSESKDNQLITNVEEDKTLTF